MAQNQAPDISTFCPPLPTPPTPPSIHFIGGALFQPSVDSTRGTPGACGLSLSILTELQAALAPFQPFLDVLDLVTQIVQCFLLLVEVVTNPFKIPDLLGCIPGLVEKLNAVLALVPILPQGIVQFVTMVVDTLRFIGDQIACLVAILTSIQQQFNEIAGLISQLNETDDLVVQSNLQTLITCGQAAAETQAMSALGAFGVIARLLCTMRALLSLVPGGAQIAKVLTFPDPSQITVLNEAISALSAVRDVILGFVDLVTSIAAPFGGILPPPPLVFKCPLDTATPAAAPATPATPTITSVTSTPTQIPLFTIPQSSSPTTDPDLLLSLVGTGYSASTQVFWNTSQIPAGKVSFAYATRLDISFPATLRATKGDFYFAAVNSASSGQAFGTAPAAVSQQFKISVV